MRTKWLLFLVLLAFLLVLYTYVKLKLPCEPEGSVAKSPRNAANGPLPSSTKAFHHEEPSYDPLSEHVDISVRGKFQRESMEVFCNKHFLGQDSISRLYDSRRHLMFDDGRKAIFCFVPKAGSTDMKRLVLYMGGRLPLETVEWPWVEDSIYIEPALQHVSFLNNSLSASDVSRRINSYYKFMIVRNPLERLASLYRDKIQRPLGESKNKFEIEVKTEILQKYNPKEYLQWKRKKYSNFTVTFQQFINYIVEHNLTSLNEHFVPSLWICHPCFVKYDFYANFRTISSDVAQLLKFFKTDGRYYRNKSLHKPAQETRMLMRSYYSSLAKRDSVKLFAALYDELAFYYTLYPLEKDSHKYLLGVYEPVLW